MDFRNPPRPSLNHKTGFRRLISVTPPYTAYRAFSVKQKFILAFVPLINPVEGITQRERRNTFLNIGFSERFPPSRLLSRLFLGISKGKPYARDRARSLSASHKTGTLSVGKISPVLSFPPNPYFLLSPILPRCPRKTDTFRTCPSPPCMMAVLVVTYSSRGISIIYC